MVSPIGRGKFFSLFRTSSLLSLVEATTSIIFVVFCRDKHVLVATKVCLSGQKLLSRYIMFVATNTCLTKPAFVMTNIVASNNFVTTKHNNVCKNFCRGKIMFVAGAGIAQWSERRTRDRKVPGSSPGRSGGRIYFSRVHLLC